jgi:hypothetical protein
MDLRDSQQLIDMDKGGEGLGPLFEEPRRRLQEEPAFRQAWAQYQAVKALAWEAAPDLDERLVRQGLQASRRQDVERRLARATGSQDAARELLLKPEGAKNGLPTWVAFLLLVGAIGLGWLAFGPDMNSKVQIPPPLPTPVADAALAFEFPANGLSETASADAGLPPSDETHGNDEVTRQARRLVNDNLRAAEAPKAATIIEPKPKAPKPSTPHPAPTKAVPRPTAIKAQPTPVPTEILIGEVEAPVTLAPVPGSSLPTLSPTPVPPVPTNVASSENAGPARFQAMEGSASEASLTLNSAQFPAQATLSLPEAGSVDLRLFDMRGRLVRRYAEGEQPAGRWRVDLSALDDQGHALTPGNYYLRAITRWFSKVEAIDQP